MCQWQQSLDSIQNNLVSEQVTLRDNETHAENSSVHTPSLRCDGDPQLAPRHSLARNAESTQVVAWHACRCVVRSTASTPNAVPDQFATKTECFRASCLHSARPTRGYACFCPLVQQAELTIADAQTLRPSSGRRDLR